MVDTAQWLLLSSYFPILWCGGVSFVLLKLTDMVVGLRVTTEEEREGLDIVLHGEQVF